MPNDCKPPEWLETPQQTFGYFLALQDNSVYEQEIELTRGEYIALQGASRKDARIRGGTMKPRFVLNYGRKPEHAIREKHARELLYSVAELRLRGWTDWVISRFLPAPDDTRQDPTVTRARG
jgi:hypothetical protein